MVESLGIAVFVFLAIKTFFGALGWYSRDGKDELYRENLDKVWDRLNAGTLFDLGHFFLQRLVSRIRQTVGAEGFSMWKLVLMAVTGNLVLFCSISLTAYLVELISGEGIDAIPMSTVKITIFYAMVSTLFGVLGDIVSVFVTWRRLKSAAKSVSPGKTFWHIFIDSSLAMLIICLSVVAGMLAMNYFFQISASNILELAGEELEFFNRLGNGLLLTTLTATLPTLFYVATGSALLALKLTPDIVSRFVKKSVYLLTTDDKPVLSQLGNIFGGTAALLASLIKLLS